MDDSQEHVMIAITGGIGAGKNVVGEILESLGQYVIDADVISRELTSEGSPILKEITGALGWHILKSDGNLDRKLVADEIFSDSAKRKSLEAILHPRIEKIYTERAKESGRKFVFVLIPLLFEAGFTEQFYEIWLCYAPKEIRLQRAMARDNVNREDIEARMRTQIPDEEKRGWVDVLIDMTGSLDDVKEQVEKELDKLLSRFPD